MLIRELFVSNVTRDIPPVVYFHEQTPAKVANEVDEYIITGGWPDDHPSHRRVPNGIHEQYVRLLKAMAAELDRPGGPELPTAWISGFYGSGKSIFAKLLGLSLDGLALPDGSSLAEALLRRDKSPHAQELRDAWKELRKKVDPIAAVFDIGAVARDNEHIHAAALRQVQVRLGYCSTEPLVADFELKLERDDEWKRFEQVAQQTLGRPWAEVKDKRLAEDDFSLVMSAMYPDRYTDPMMWFTSRAGTHSRSESPEEAVHAIRDMLKFRKPGATLFLVVDEVSQYVLGHPDRGDRMRAFATALGASLKGKAWLLALGQQQLEEQADNSFLVWAKDRFPPKLRVHLHATNIRDVVHRRLLHKKPDAEAVLRELFARHRPDLKLFAYGCENITEEEFVEVYPLLPGHIDLLLQITTALRTRSARAQGDDQAIRGLLQLLGELFRAQKLAEQPVGALVTLDQIYEVQHTALDSDAQASMARILSKCADDTTGLRVRVAKAVALLELIQETVATDAKLVAQCLYDRVDRGSQVGEVTEALEQLRRDNLLGYSEKTGYKIQSSAGEEWERERRDIAIPRETISEVVQDALKLLLAAPERPKLQGRPFPWAGYFSDGRSVDEATLVDPRTDASVRVDFRFLVREERTESSWVRRSGDEPLLQGRIVWICGDTTPIDDVARDLARSRAMVKRLKPRRESLNASRKMLLTQEDIRVEELEGKVRDAVAEAWMGGRLYFRGEPVAPQDQGASFSGAISSVASRFLPKLYHNFVPVDVQPSELTQLLESELSGPSPKFLADELGILELDSGRYVPTCAGVVPRRLWEHIEAEGGVSGSSLLAHFSAPPYGYTPNVIKACVAGLLRATRLRIQTESGAEITAMRDAGVRELFDKDRSFRRATLFPSGDDDIGPQSRARICKLFEQQLEHPMNREDDAIANAVARIFPAQAKRLRDVLSRLDRLPGPRQTPDVLERLQDVLEQCLRSCRQTQPTVKLLKKHLDTLGDGIQRLNLYDAELTAEAVQAVRDAAETRDHAVAQLRDVGGLATDVESAAARVDEHLVTERPWQDVRGLDTDLETIRHAYQTERGRRLAWQEEQVEQARSRVTGREGFATLTGDQAHRVLKPLAAARTDTTVEAIAPALAALRDSFLLALSRAETEADEILDAILSEGDEPLIVKVDLKLRNREIATEAQVDALVDEIRGRLLEHVPGSRVRIM